MEKWKNITYKVEWFAEGKTLKSEEICGGLPLGQENSNACPNKNLDSLLPGRLYKIGQSVC